jgi:membrane protein YqaA with SNARE-associated domain
MTRLLDFAHAVGGPGILLVAFLDSSFLSLPEVNDLLVVWMVTRYKPLMFYYAGMATLGSVGGCLTLFYLGRRGGEALLRKRFRGEHIERAMRVLQRYGALAIVVPALLPPPAPFKLFVLMAGVAQVKPSAFAAAVAMARGVRYFGLGLLALWYGDLAIEWVRAHGVTVLLCVAVVILATGIALVVWRSRRLSASSRSSGSV